MWGLAAGVRHIFPFRHFQTIDTAIDAARAQYGGPKNDTSAPRHLRYGNLWYPRNRPGTGVVVHEPALTEEGVTFFTGWDTSATLVDMDGNVLHRWSKPYSEVWRSPPHMIAGFDDVNICWRNARLLPSGDIIVIYEGNGKVSPYGAGLAKLDKHSRLLWRADINAHHDLDLAPDGRIYVLTLRYNKSPVRIDEFITILSPDGLVLDEISLLRAFRESPYSNLVPAHPMGDYMHNNNIDILDAEMAKHFPWLRQGDILLSQRYLSAICVLDSQRNTIKWALSGLSLHQHDPDFLTSGRIVFFDNDADFGRGLRGSRILQYDCSLREASILYSDSDAFYTELRGSQQMLENGNCLITESTAGLITEVTPQGKIAWQYITTSADSNSVGIVCSARRLKRSEFSFLDESSSLSTVTLP